MNPPTDPEAGALRRAFHSLRKDDRLDCPPVEPMLARARRATAAPAPKPGTGPMRLLFRSLAVTAASAAAVLLVARWHSPAPADLRFVGPTALLTPAPGPWLDFPARSASWSALPSSALLSPPSLTLFPD